MGAYPIEIGRDLYLTKFGGWSTELRDNQLGLNRKRLEQTNLPPFAKVFIKKVEESKNIPLFKREFFEVIPVDETFPETFSKSLCGEVVLPYEKAELEIEEGSYLVLNSALNALDAPETWVEKLVVKFLKRRGWDLNP